LLLQVGYRSKAGVVARRLEVRFASDSQYASATLPHRGSILGRIFFEKRGAFGLALQLPFMQVSESMGNHDSKIVDAASVD
jgi:hypothetical protein